MSSAALAVAFSQHLKRMQFRQGLSFSCWHYLRHRSTTVIHDHNLICVEGLAFHRPYDLQEDLHKDSRSACVDDTRFELQQRPNLDSFSENEISDFDKDRVQPRKSEARSKSQIVAFPHEEATKHSAGCVALLGLCQQQTLPCGNVHEHFAHRPLFNSHRWQIAHDVAFSHHGFQGGLYLRRSGRESLAHTPLCCGFLLSIPEEFFLFLIGWLNLWNLHAFEGGSVSCNIDEVCLQQALAPVRLGLHIHSDKHRGISCPDGSA
mmetsp:Transcript_43768/g.103425  ORF Transcript_43768/g.103425 Transcript_43768/m.103425 type:complete len:263 (-) Transcript_43768:555-1343(-)